MKLYTSIDFGTLTDWLIAVGTIATAIVAVFQDRIRQWLHRPILKVSITPAPPDCVLNYSVKPGPHGTLSITPVYFLRLFVENIGDSAAKNVEIYARALRIKSDHGNWELVNNFPPMNLTWEYDHSPLAGQIAPGTGKHCDLLEIKSRTSRMLPIPWDPAKSYLEFALVHKPNNHGHLHLPGEYQLEIVVSSENTRPITGVVNMYVPEDWRGTFAGMFGDGGIMVSFTG